MNEKPMPLWMQIQRVSSYNKKTALGLCFLGFIGVAGLHRFYVRQHVTGLLYLLTAGIFGIGTCVDVVRLLTNCFKDGDGLCLESAARKRWDDQYAKWRYVYWSMACGRYFIDVTSIIKEENLIHCSYLVELNFFGKNMMPIKNITYAISHVTFQTSMSEILVLMHKGEFLDQAGNVIVEAEGAPWESVRKDSMDECIYLFAMNSQRGR